MTILGNYVKIIVLFEPVALGKSVKLVTSVLKIASLINRRDRFILTKIHELI